jgi:hypothetical protein
MNTDSISNSDSYDEPTNSSNKVTTDEARDRLEDTLFFALESASDTLINAPTALGKSHTVATTPWRDHPDITGEKPVIHIHQTTDARDDAIEDVPDLIDDHVLRGREEACPVARGDYDDELTAPDGSNPSDWFNQKCNVERISFSHVHIRLRKALGYLPCNQEGNCPAGSQWQEWTTEDDDPRYDVIHATQKFAFVNGLIDEANVIFDEQPDFEMSLTDGHRDHLRQAISNLLHHRSDGEYTISDLITSARHGWEEPLEELSSLLEEEVTDEWLFSREETHRLAPKIGRAIASAKPISDTRYCGRDGNLTMVFTDKGKLRYIHHRPNLEQARCVIGLDAHPVIQLWQANTIDGLEQTAVLSDTERDWWRRHERGLRIVRIGKARRSNSNGWQSDTEEDRAGAIIRNLRGKYGKSFRTAICASSVKDDVRRMLKTAGVADPNLIHYGNEKSQNKFESESGGCLLGCLDPGDEPILDWLALCGLEAEPETITKDGEVKRKPGRGFTGPDADAADDFLGSVRENHLAQSAGRYARNPDEKDSGATVYGWSAALPDSLTDKILDTEYTNVTETRKKMAEYVQESTTAVTKKEIAGEFDVAQKTAWELLTMMVEQGIASVSEETGTHGAYKYKHTEGELRTIVEFSER